MNAIILMLHAIAATVWVGGMFFAYLVLRPSIALLEPHRRLVVWAGVFRRFFVWVWIAVVTLPVTGYLLVFRVFGGFSSLPIHIHLMHMLGLSMCAVFVFLYFTAYPVFKAAVVAEDWAHAATALNRIRQLVLINLVLGMSLLFFVFTGRYYLPS